MLFHGAEGHQRSNGQIRNPKQFWCIVFLCHYQDPLQAGIDCWIMWLYSIGPTGVKLEIASVWHSWSASMLSMSLVNTRVGFRVHICGGKSAYKVHSGGKKKTRRRKRETLPKTKAMNGFWELPPSLPWRNKRSQWIDYSHARSSLLCCRSEQQCICLRGNTELQLGTWRALQDDWGLEVPAAHRSEDHKRGGESGRRGPDEVWDGMRAGWEKEKEKRMRK